MTLSVNRPGFEAIGIPSTGVEALQMFPCRCDISDSEETKRSEQALNAIFIFMCDDPYQLPFTFMHFSYLTAMIFTYYVLLPRSRKDAELKSGVGCLVPQSSCFPI